MELIFIVIVILAIGQGPNIHGIVRRQHGLDLVDLFMQQREDEIKKAQLQKEEQ